MPDFSKRNLTIDNFRAVTMFLMVFVNDFWTVGGIPHCLEHGGTREDFLGLADFVFPWFLFAVGLSIPYAMERRYGKGCSELSTVFHILERTLALLVMGVFFANTEVEMSQDMIMGKSLFRVMMIAGFFLIWNTYPANAGNGRKLLFRIFRIIGVFVLAFLMIIYRDSDGGVFSVRGWGILGQIGWIYLLCSFLYLAFRASIRKFTIAWLLCFILCVICACRLLPGDSFLYSFLKILNIPPGAKPGYCIGGIITTLAALELSGRKTGYKITLAASVAAILMLAGFACHHFWIFSKNMQTPPTMLVCTAAAILLYCLIAIPVSYGWTGTFKPLKSAGTATLTCYTMPILIYSVLRLAGLEPETGLYGLAGVVKCILFSSACVFLTFILEKAGIKLKI